MVEKLERLMVYIEDAKGFLKEADEVFSKGVKENNPILIRDAADKAWNAVVQATNALILHFLAKVPSSHFERRRLLSVLEDKVSEAEKLGFRDRYGARERNLHELVFYEGIIDLDEVRRELEKAKTYVEDAESVTKQTHVSI